MPSSIVQYNFPTRIQYGPGAAGLLAGALLEVGARRPLLVTDRGLAPLPPVTGAVDGLRSSGLEPAVFAGVWGNPVKSQVSAGVAAYRSHQADAVVGIGGGAALDVAKAIALMVEHPGDLFDYEDEKPGARPIDRPIPPFMTIPTTAGTGSEVGRSTVVSDDETHVKKIIFSPRLLASRVFVDPLLTLALPPAITAATGMDALTHLVEAYLAKGSNPLCDGIALEGVRLVARHFEAAVQFARQAEADLAAGRAVDGSDAHIAARGGMMNAALMGAVAFQKGLGVTHSLAHALSTVRDLHHGLANGIVLPTALAFNRDAVPERLADLAQAAGASPPTAQGFIDWVRALKRRIGIPASLADVAVPASDLERLVAVATTDACHPNNPRPVSAADFRHLFQEAGLQ